MPRREDPQLPQSPKVRASFSPSHPVNEPARVFSELPGRARTPGQVNEQDLIFITHLSDPFQLAGKPCSEKHHFTPSCVLTESLRFCFTKVSDFPQEETRRFNATAHKPTSQVCREREGAAGRGARLITKENALGASAPRPACTGSLGPSSQHPVVGKEVCGCRAWLLPPQALRLG